MNTHSTIQRQYDEIIAPHYDRDPGSILASSFQRGITQIQNTNLLQSQKPLQALDIGIGTGSFLSQIAALTESEVSLSGLDISEKMLDIARTKIPNLKAVVDTAANLEHHFVGKSFDLICSHFITGFVPMSELAPKIWDLLEEGGYWSLIGQTMAGYPTLRKKEASLPYKVFRWFSSSPKVEMDIVCNPKGRGEVLETFRENGFEVCHIETFEPQVDFANIGEFLDFGYRSGWLTPFIEKLGIHKASKMFTLVMNLLFFPCHDHLSIEIALAQKVSK